MRLLNTLILAALFQALTFFAGATAARADLVIACVGCSSTVLGGTAITATQSLAPPSFTLSRNPNDMSGLPRYYGVSPVVLIPNNTVNGDKLSFTEKMTQGGIAIATGTAVCDLACTVPGYGLASVWTTSDLLTYFGDTLVSGPLIPFGSLLAATQAVDPGATGYFVYVPVGRTAPTFAAGNDPAVQFSDIGVFPAGTVFAALATGLNSDFDWLPSANGYDATGTAYSLILTGSTPSVPEPSTWAMMLLGLSGLSYAGYRKTKARFPVAAAPCQ
jgi:hypothetical protein